MENKPDLLIVARGGGSLEDLWSFNDEVIVRAVAASSIPVISAIGHETDTTLIDHVADWRAPTPTAAAEKAVPVRADLVAELASLNARQRRAIGRVLQERQLRLQSASRALPKPDEVLAIARQRFDSVAARLPGALKTNVQRHRLALLRTAGRLTPQPLRMNLKQSRLRLNEYQRRSVRGLTQLLARRKERLLAETKLFASLNYRAVLSRGFAIIRNDSGRPLRQAIDVGNNAKLSIEFADGNILATTIPLPKQGSLF